MTVIGFHASHEQVHPTALLRAVRQARDAGFTAAMCSDHFSPWSERQGQSAFAWSWLGAALATTDVIRDLCAGQEVTHDGLVTVDRARVWTIPETPPALIGPAVSEGTARMAAGWADGLVTVNAPHDHLRRMVDAYREAGGRGRLSLQVHLSWAPTQAEAEAIAHDQWRSNVFAPPLCWDLETAAHFDDVYLHHVGSELSDFVDAFGKDVLPQVGVEPMPPVVPAPGRRRAADALRPAVSV